MGEKKQPGRFTVQFNLKDPQQRVVSELLEQQGRHKAQFITSAILRYIQCPNPQEYAGRQPVMDEAALEQMLSSFLEKHPLFTSAPADDIPQAKESPTQRSSDAKVWDDAMDDDAMRAISDTLSAFRQG